MRRCFICLALVLSLVTSIQAEKVNIRTLAITPGQIPKIWTVNGAESALLSFSSSQPSEILRLERVSPLPLYQTEPIKDGPPAIPPPMMLKLPIGSDILLLGWMAAGKPQFVPIKDTPASGKFNDWFVINSTRKQIAVQIGQSNKPVLIQPMVQVPLKIDQPAGKGTAVVLATKETKGWTKFFSTYWPVHADKRGLIVIIANGERVDANLIFDDLKRTPPEKER